MSGGATSPAEPAASPLAAGNAAAGPSRTPRSRPGATWKKACDQCHFRKIKCTTSATDGSSCAQCERNDLQCTSLKIHRPRGPKRTRLALLQTRGQDDSKSANGSEALDAFSPPAPPNLDERSSSQEVGSREQSELRAQTASSEFYAPFSPASFADAGRSSNSFLERTTSYDRGSGPFGQSAHQAISYDRYGQPPLRRLSNSQSMLSASPNDLPPSALAASSPHDRFTAPNAGFQTQSNVLAPAPSTDFVSAAESVPTLDMNTLWEDWPIQSAVMGAQGGLSIFNWAYDGAFDWDLGPGALSRGSPMRMECGFNSRFGTDSIAPVVVASAADPHELAGQQPSHRHPPLSVGPPPPLEDPVTIHPKYDTALKLYAERFFPMFPVLKDKRLRSDLQEGKLFQSTSFSILMDSILVLQESTEVAESASTADGQLNGDQAGRPLSPRLAALAGQSPRIDDLGVDTVMVALHLFVALELQGDKAAAWFRLQEAMTLAHMLGPPKSFGVETEEHIRLYWILFIAERGMLLLQNVPVHVDRVLRMSDNAYAQSTVARDSLPDQALNDFPMSHLRLFSLIKSDHLACWRSLCEPGCKAWTSAEAVNLQQSLDEEYRVAVLLYSLRVSTEEKSIQAANLVVSIAWFRDRVWNLCFKHGLIRSGGPRELDFQLVRANLVEVTDFCTRIRTSDLIAGPDCPAKLYDMAMTAVELFKRSQMPDSALRQAGQPSKTLSDFQQGLISVAYKTLGWLAAIERDHPVFSPDLIKAISKATIM